MSHLRRLGVFGGAFDPPHLAHVALVRSAIEALDLQQVRVLPTGQAWHKTRPLGDAMHRLAMTRLAFADVPEAVVDDREIRRQGPSFTVDTLGELQLEQPGAQLYLLIGDDQRRALPSWRQIADIGRMAIICAAARDAQVAAWDADQPPAHASASVLKGIRPLQMPRMDISATDIRERLSRRQPITGLVPPAVERYIHEHHLYTE